MNTGDQEALTEYWSRETEFVNRKVDHAFKAAQDHAYALGLRRGRQPFPANVAPLNDEQITSIAESMPGGLDGFCKGWGWQQFARAIEKAHGIGAEQETQQ